MRKLIILIGLMMGLSLTAQAQQVTVVADCLLRISQQNPGAAAGVTALTTVGTSALFDNRGTGCVNWTLVYSSYGFSAATIQVVDAPNNNEAPGTPVAFQGTITTSGVTQPVSISSSGTYNMTGYYPYMGVSLVSKTGTGRVEGVLYGWRSGAFGSASVIGTCGGSSGQVVYSNGSALACDSGLTYTANGAGALATTGNIIIGAAKSLEWGSSGVATPDLFLFRDAANTLAQRNGTTSQESRTYYSYTDASNYRFVAAIGAYTGSNPGIYEHGAGTGAGGSLYVAADASVYLTPGAGTVGWQVENSTIAFKPTTDNSYTIGDATHRASNIFGVLGTFGVATNASGVGDLYVANNSGSTIIAMEQNSGNTSAGELIFRKSRSTAASRTNIANGDLTFYIEGQTYSNSYQDGSVIEGYVDGTFTAGQAPPTGVKVLTNAANGAQALALTIDSAQNSTFGGTVTAGVTSTTVIGTQNVSFRTAKVLLDATSSCAGSGCVLAAGSSPTSGKVTTTTTGVATITITFQATWTTAPACHATNETTANILKATSTTTTLVITGTTVASDSIAYSCVGH